MTRHLYFQVREKMARLRAEIEVKKAAPYEPKGWCGT
jgi:hypothetical protein